MALMDKKDPAEIVALQFDFCALMGTSTIASAVCSIAIVAGNPGQSLTGMLPGTPVISGPRVTQRLAGGLSGSVYRIKCLATMADGRVQALSADVPVATVFGA